MEMFPLPLPAETVHHLPSLAANVHRAYFWKMPPLRVRWGQQIGRKRRRSIRLGSYNHHTTEIRVHPLLNMRQIPAFVIESIIHHEYLHHVLGANHDRRFHAQERKFHYYRESQEWIRRNLFLLLGCRRRELERPQRVPAPPAVPATQQQMVLF
jgi:hypothetical protein